MKLPAISSRSAETEDLMELKERYNPFLFYLERVIEVRIYLKFNFHKNDIDDNFISDIEDEYAVQYLTKMQTLPTNDNIKKLLSFRPIEKCDFHLSTEMIRDKQIKVIHIYPNGNKNVPKTVLGSGKEKLKIFLSNEDFEKVIKRNKIQVENKKRKEDELVNIQSRQGKLQDNLLFNKEVVDNMIAKAKDDIIDKQLYAESNGMRIDLSIEAVREKYINPSSGNIIEHSADDRTNNQKGKFYHINKAKKRNILNDPRYAFPILTIRELNKEIIDEIAAPVDVPIEIIMKDVNYILDNFPIEALVELSSTKPFEIPQAKQLYQKIQTVSRADVLSVYKKLQATEVYRVIGLCINLVYWLVFGIINRIQVDHVTKEFLYIKLLKQITLLQANFPNKKLCHKLFVPLLIMVVRIECENVLLRKFTKFFSNESTRKIAMEKVNSLITSIFDPHCYFNTFTITSGNAGALKHKLSKSVVPNYKSKIFATSNLLDEMFIIDEYDKKEKGEMKKFISNEKVDFFADLLEKVNKGLKKRNLEPIFTVKKKKDTNRRYSGLNSKGDTSTNSINVDNN